jgi:hypothetical protein
MFFAAFPLSICPPILSERRVSNPQPPAWKAGALPIELLSLIFILPSTLFEWGQEDSNLRSRNNRFTVCPIWPLWYIPFQKNRAEEGTRTPDLLITNQWLYQLSYFGLFLMFKERPLFIGVANLVTIFIVTNKNDFFFVFYTKNIY